MRQQRIPVVLAVLMLGFLGIQARLVQLQAVEVDLWQRESRLSTVRFDSLPFERGWITDRRGVPLARTEEVRDLVFRYRDWRRDSVAGALAHAFWSLDQPLDTVPQALARVDERLAELGTVSVADIARQEPRQRRRDILFYVRRLVGERVTQAIQQRLSESNDPAPVPLAELDGFDAGLLDASGRAAREAEALVGLASVAGVAPDDLVAAMDDAMHRAHKRVRLALADEVPDVLDESAGRGRDDAPTGPAVLVQASLAGGAASRALGWASADHALLRERSPVLETAWGDPRDRYMRRQTLHAEFDTDPYVLRERVPYDARTLVAIRGRDLGGFAVRTDERRVYPPEVADVAPLIVGITGEPEAEDIQRGQLNRIRLAELHSLSDLTAEELDEYERLRILVREVDVTYGEERGREGVEAAFESVLRGKRGWVATSLGGEVTEVERAEPQRGQNVTLTLDVDLQRACQEVLDAVFEEPCPVEGADLSDMPERWTGAIVLLDVETGAVRALASGPRPTREQLTHERGWLFLEDEWARMRHRAVRPGHTANLPPPGSTFKPISALAGMASGLVSAHTVYECEGRLRTGSGPDDSMGCLGFHGPIDMTTAIAKSCNVWFYHLGARVGADGLREIAERFGLGGRAPLLVGNEVLAGLGVPVGSGFRESATRLGEGPYTRTDGMRLAIGQAPLDDVTPLQVASMMAAVGSGVWRPPMLVQNIEAVGDIPPGSPRDLGLGEGQLRAARRGLASVVDGGTGRHLHESHPELAPFVAGKTGTAEVGGSSRDHSWFAGYMPRSRPRLAFAVLIEDSGLHGNEAALPVFERLLAKPAVRDMLVDEVLPAGALDGGGR